MTQRSLRALAPRSLGCRCGRWRRFPGVPARRPLGLRCGLCVHAMSDHASRPPGRQCAQLQRFSCSTAFRLFGRRYGRWHCILPCAPAPCLALCALALRPCGCRRGRRQRFSHVPAPRPLGRQRGCNTGGGVVALAPPHPVTLPAPSPLGPLAVGAGGGIVSLAPPPPTTLFAPPPVGPSDRHGRRQRLSRAPALRPLSRRRGRRRRCSCTSAPCRVSCDLAPQPPGCRRGWRQCLSRSLALRPLKNIFLSADGAGGAATFFAP